MPADHSGCNDSEMEVERAVSIYASRETLPLLERTLGAAVAACGAVPSVVDVLINGNPELARTFAGMMAPVKVLPNVSVQVWALRLGDKANAWNQYIHTIAPASHSYFFVDGYARLHPTAIDELERASKRPGEVLAATGLPAVGVSARALANQMLAFGGIHGNFYMLTRAAVEQLRALRFRLPLGIYRTDATLGAALAYGLDLHPRRQWRLAERVVVCDRARWDIDGLRWWRLADLEKQRQRILRQAQGDLENRAVRQLFSMERAPLGALPRTTLELVEHWLAADSAAAQSFLRWHPLRLRALTKIRERRDWSAANAQPECLARSGEEAGGRARLLPAGVSAVPAAATES
jgi:hypothetical protein